MQIFINVTRKSFKQGIIFSLNVAKKPKKKGQYKYCLIRVVKFSEWKLYVNLTTTEVVFYYYIN